MTNKPILVEIYAWNEVIMSLVALGWSLFLALFGWETALEGRRVVLALIVGTPGLALLLVQNGWLRTQLDFRLPAELVKLLPNRLARQAIKIWPATTIVRVTVHFFFSLWWTLMCVAVTLSINSLDDIRLVFYAGFALLHFDRLMRLLVWLRR